MNTPQPVVKAFLICDQIIQDSQTGKMSLIGLFQDLRADRFRRLKNDEHNHHTMRD